MPDKTWLRGEEAYKQLLQHKVILIGKHGDPQFPGGQRVSMTTITEWMRSKRIEPTDRGWRLKDA